MEVTNLSHQLLANNPEHYLNILRHCKNNQIDVKKQINSQQYETWYSNHLFCLSYLVGDLVKDDFDSEFYGKQFSISNHLGIEILNNLISLGVDVHSKNYYDQTVFDCIMEKNVLTSRKNNEEFKEALLNIRRCPSP